MTEGAFGGKVMKKSFDLGRESGLAIVTVAALMVVIMGLVAMLFRVLSASHSEQGQYRDDLRALYVAEAGLSEAYLDIEELGAGNIGSADVPRLYGTAEYFVETEDLGLRVYAMRSTGIDAGSTERIEMVVREIPDGFFQYAAFGKVGVQMAASSFVDSYDSSLGAYADQYDSTNGHAGTFGNVGSDGDITLLTNSQIWGNATPGMGHEVIYAGPNSLVSGTTQQAEMETPFPPIDVPVIASTGVLHPGNGEHVVLPAGDYHYSSLLSASDSHIEIQGPARVVVDDLTMVSNSTLTIDATFGPVELYATGDFDLRSNSELVTKTDRPHDAMIYLSGDNVDGTPPNKIKWDANSEYIGVIYAPEAALEFDAQFELFGSVMGYNVQLNANSAVHYDVSLLFDDTNGDPEFETLSWRPIATGP